jgi:hypothetical protein
MSLDLSAVRAFALSLPEAVEAPHHDMTSCRVRGKIFLTVPPEQTHLHIFVPEPARAQALAMHPEYLEKLYWGGKVMGVRAELAQADAAVIEALIRAAWVGKAPSYLTDSEPKDTSA